MVIGVGNPFRGDDGVGHRVVDLFSQHQRSESRDSGQVPGRPFELGWSDGEPTRLIEAWHGVDVCVVVDAMVTGAPPGTVRVFDGFVDDLPARSPTSSHGSGVAEAVALGEALDDLPGRLIVVGVEVSTVAEGTDLSPRVQASVPRVWCLVCDSIDSRSTDRDALLAAQTAAEPVPPTRQQGEPT